VTDDRQLVRFAKWRPLGFAWVASLLGLVLITTLTCLLMKHRRHNQLVRLRVGLVYYLQHQATYLHRQACLQGISEGFSRGSAVAEALPTACLSAEIAELSSPYVMIAKARLHVSSSFQFTATALCQEQHEIQAIDPYPLISHRSLPDVVMMDSAMLLTTSHADLWSTLMYNNINNQVNYTYCL